MLASAAGLAQAHAGHLHQRAGQPGDDRRRLDRRPAGQTGRLRRVVIVGLGTNGPITADQISQLRRAVGDRWLVLVNTFVPRSWEHEVNSTLASAARRYPNVLLVNWYAAIQPHQRLLWSDDIHPQPVGGKLYAKVVRSVVQRALDRRPRLNRPRSATRSADRLPSARQLRHAVLMPKETAAERPGYEQARDQLADLVKRLEAGGLTLEQSLELWERGERLAAICEEWLEGAQGQASRGDQPARRARGQPRTTRRGRSDRLARPRDRARTGACAVRHRYVGCDRGRPPARGLPAAVQAGRSHAGSDDS